MNTKINTVIEALEQAQKCVYSRSGFLAQEYINDALALLRSLPEQGEGPTDTELMNIAVSEAEVAHPSTDRRNYSGPRADEWYEEERDRIADRRKLHASVLFEERRRVRDSYAFNAGRLSAGHQQGEPVAWMRIRQGPAPDKGARGLFFTREEAEKWWSGTHDTIIPLYAHPPQVGPEEKGEGDAASESGPRDPLQSSAEDSGRISATPAIAPAHKSESLSDDELCAECGDPYSAHIGNTGCVFPCDELCAECGDPYSAHIGNTGCVFPCWTPSGIFK